MKILTITRSFSFKRNLGNYQMQDYFCSQTAECDEGEEEKVSEQLHTFCKNEVIKSVNQDIKSENILSETEKAYNRK